MNEIFTEVSAMIDETPEKVYAVLADYREGHPRILPKKYFTDISVERGGNGEGTIVNVSMSVMGVEQKFHFEISEPAPGRILVETDEAAGVVTTFKVEPSDGGRRSLVTIVTRAKASKGIKGKIERLVNPLITRHIYKIELKQLADYVSRNSETGENKN